MVKMQYRLAITYIYYDIVVIYSHPQTCSSIAASAQETDAVPSGFITVRP
jgi:hypothetical protein